LLEKGLSAKISSFGIMVRGSKTDECDTFNQLERASYSLSPSSKSLNDVLEKLYRSYSIKQKRSSLECFIIASIMFDLYAIIVPQTENAQSIGKNYFYIFLAHFRTG
jgi:hypothetical protein